MLINVLIAIAAVIVGFVIFVATRPPVFRVTRSATISAPVAIVFAQVNDLHKWEEWSPWAKLDPTAKNSYEGSPSGSGAIFSWSGNNKVGAGRMTITESRSSSFIGIKLEFLRPFRATNAAEFTFQSAGNQTVVTWSMAGKNNFAAKAFGLFANCNKMIGGEFEKGLAQLKSIAEVTTTK